MATEKREERLLARIEDDNRRVSAAAHGADEGRRHPVLLVLSGSPDTTGDSSDRAASMADMSEQLREVHTPVTSSLEEAAGDQSYEHLPLVNAIRAELTEEEMLAVAENDEVQVVLSDHVDEVALLEESRRVIELPEAVADHANGAFTATGVGKRVAVIDSGVDNTHPAFFGRIVDEVDTTGAGLAPGSHGTHVAGIVASADPVQQGVAPGAELINVKVLDGGFAQPSWVIMGLQEAFLRGADVVNLSLGWSEIFHGWVCNDADCVLCQAVDSIVGLGTVAVVAAGNEGTLAGPGQHNIRHPGAARGALTVGSLDKAKQLSTFSSIGPGSGRLSPTSTIELTKPDLAAPGSDIISTLPGGTFGALSGTSMAAPHVAGLAALLLERHGVLSPQMVKKMLETSCEDVVLGPNEAGYGLVNAYAALM